MPCLTDQRLLLLVHAARDMTGKSEHDMRSAWHDVSPEERDEIDAVAARLDAMVPLAIATGRHERAKGRRSYHLWMAMSVGANPTEVWKARLLDAEGLRGKARILWAATHVNPDHLALRLGHEPDSRELRREWWVRWGRGARRLLGLR